MVSTTKKFAPYLVQMSPDLMDHMRDLKDVTIREIDVVTKPVMSLYFFDLSDPFTVAAMIRHIVMYERVATLQSPRIGSYIRRDRTINEQISRFFESNTDEVIRSLQFGRLMYAKNRIMSVSMYGFLHYILSKIDRNSAEAFLRQLASAEELENDHMIRRLYEKLMFYRNRRNRLNSEVTIWMTMSTWNAVRGMGIQDLVFMPSKKFPLPL